MLITYRNIKASIERGFIEVVSTVLLCTITSSIVAGSDLRELPSKLTFQNLLQNQDIVLGEVLAITEDEQGFMWFGGTNALLRYDGYEFRSFYMPQEHGDATPKTPIRFVHALLKDSLGRIWISADGNLLIYHHKTDEITIVPKGNSEDGSIDSHMFEALIELPNGKILAGADNGLFVIDPNTFNYAVYTEKTDSKPGLSNRNIHTVTLDGDTVWIGTDGGLDAYDWQAHSFMSYKVAPENASSVGDNAARGIIPIGNGEYWVATFNGLVHYNIHTKTSKRYTHDPEDPKSLSGNMIWTLYKDTQDRLWVLTDSAGLCLYNKNKDNFTSYLHSSSDPNSLASNTVRTVLQDSNGDFWIGHYPEGISYFDTSTTAITSYSANENNARALSHKSVLSIQQDKKGELWIGTDGGGLNSFNPETGLFKHYKHNINNDNSVSSNAILTTFIDSSDELWAGTWGGGVFKYNRKNDNFERLPFDHNRAHEAAIVTSKKLASANAWCVYEDSTKTLWICTHSGGLSKYDRQTLEFTNYTPIDDDETTISSFMVWTVLEDSKGRFWVGTANGISLMDRTKGSFSRHEYKVNTKGSISHPNVISIFEDSRGTVWFGTDNGLNKYNEKTDNFTSYGQLDGFIDVAIRSIQEDTDGNLWLGTSNGLIRFNPVSGTVKNINRIGSKLTDGFNYNAANRISNGDLVFGGVNGLRILNPSQIQPNKRPPPIVLTDFKIFSDSVPINGPNKILTKTINNTTQITLDHTKSMFVFHFSALNYRDSEKNQFSYKLEGFDNSWINAGGQRTAKYTNLDPGKYTFHVIGSNNDNIWNKMGKSITIIQLPPPWKSWWAYTLYCIFTLSAILYFIYYQHRKRQLVEQQNRILEIRVAERTRELHLKNEDIQSMLSNIHQGLFTLEDNGIIHPEYSSYLESILETTDIANRHVMDILFQKTNLTSDMEWQVREALSTMSGEHACNFDFNKHILPRSLDVTLNGKIKHLSIDWDPIIVDQKITKIMVAVRDVTKIREMEKHAANKQRELEIIGHLLGVNAKRYHNFEKATQKFLTESKLAVSQTQKFDKEVLALLFRYMHTLKGNSRTLGFKFISAAAHDAESHLSALQHDNSLIWEQERLLNDLELVEAIVKEYNKTYHETLGQERQASPQDDGSGVWLDESSIQKIISSTQEKHTSTISNLIEEAQSQPLEKVLKDVLNALPSIAHQLGKPAPKINIEVNGLLVKKSASTLLCDIFSHLLRNSLDHGIEAPDARVESGKSKTGTINIYTIKASERLELHINDDGQGINTAKIYHKGLNEGFWHPREKLEPIDIVQYIFQSGVSTKDEVSDISGRGVGMDAVKQFLIERDGDIEIQLRNQSRFNPDLYNFELIISLPLSLFVLKPNLQKTVKFEGR